MFFQFLGKVTYLSKYFENCNRYFVFGGDPFFLLVPFFGF